MNRSEQPSEGVELDEYLRKLCSDVTLHSPKDGFFNHYVEQIDAQISHHFLKKFGKLGSDEERLRTTWGVKPIHTLKVQSFYKQKSRKVSETRRAEGNRAFQEKKNQQALVLYSQAVMRAPHDDGASLALAYANRSAVLFHMKQFELCLTDIELAIQASYPSNLMFKVLDRRGQCLRQLGQHNDALQAFTAAFQALGTAALDDKKLQSWKKDISAKIRLCQEKDNNGEPPPPPKQDTGAAVFEGPNSALPNASAAISIQVSPDEGRYAVVTRNVPAGQVLMAERPYAAILMDNKSGTHCQHCYNRLVSAVPCRWCSGVAFCSPRCRDLALATYHRWECKFLDLLKGSGVSLNCYLALRVVTQHGLPFFKKLRRRLQEPATLPTASSPHRPDDYMTFYHLVGLEEQRSSKDFFQRSLVATFLLKVLQRADFFGKWDDEGAPDKDLTEEELLVGGLLLRHLQVIQFNAHELSGMSFAGGMNNYRETKSVFLGLAVYPTVAFCNHSCFPAVTRYFEGDRMVIVSLRPLRPGDVVAENYGPIFTHQPRQERHRKLLSRYWFKCGCEACEEDWPIYANMADRKVLRCQKCKSPLPPRGQTQSHVKCRECGSSNNAVAAFKTVEQAEKFYVAACKHMEEGQREEAISSFTRFLDVVSDLVVPPLREMHLAMQSLRLLIASRGTIHTYDIPTKR
ncbi:SET and MYND domain-containing protein 4-like [Panulirus ornatus]|uniref:SET and MYND domain-containing protein 4-like n=1 Tax=Panulirus ornatus TaxID=150431 RepID=UPI003A890DE8